MNTLNAAVEAFSKGIEAADGEMKNRIVNPRGAYCRAVLPLEETVQRRDVLHHGAALRMHLRMLEVVPFVFRQVCSNGAIWSHNAAAFSLQITDTTTEQEIAEFVEFSTETAASADTFQSCLAEIRAGISKPIDISLSIMAMFGGRGSRMEETALALVLAEMANQPEARTRYDAMNIVTAAAREVPDPELKWRMESLATTLLLDVEVRKKALPRVRAREFAEV